ncbi:conserved Plasmodium protein, unknown function [Plasmodium sp. gorilla clade G3]|nr:conserved Plasmodium protein, unknown function [Plasmodium sp. gorilla clade G3]
MNRIIYMIIIILALLNCKSYAKSKLKKGNKKGKKNVSLGGEFLGDITPMPNSVYNMHVDLNKNYELNNFVRNENEHINKILFLMYKEHNNTMKELEEIMNSRQNIIQHLIKEMEKLKDN